MNTAPGAATARAASLIERLDLDSPAVGRQDAARELVAMGMDAIPALIAALGDTRIHARRDRANRQNLPATAPQPAPLMVTMTVGERCEDLLYEIITPPTSSRQVPQFKVFSEQVLKVDDWHAWWAANKDKSLTAIHAELRPLVDAYWRQHGATQKVTSG